MSECYVTVPRCPHSMSVPHCPHIPMLHVSATLSPCPHTMSVPRCPRVPMLRVDASLSHRPTPPSPYPHGSPLTRAWAGDSPVPSLEQMLAANPGKTPISLLQEYGTRIGKTPGYDLLKAEGQAHQPNFTFRVTVGDISCTGGSLTPFVSRLSPLLTPRLVG